MIRTPDECAAEAARLAGRGLAAAAAFLANRLRETLSVPATRVGGRGLRSRYTPAVPGAPPRKRTGRLRASVAWAMADATTATVGVGARYGRYLELGTGRMKPHPFLMPTVQANLANLRQVVGRAVAVSEPPA